MIQFVRNAHLNCEFRDLHEIFSTGSSVTRDTRPAEKLFSTFSVRSVGWHQTTTTTPTTQNECKNFNPTEICGHSKFECAHHWGGRRCDGVPGAGQKAAAGPFVVGGETAAQVSFWERVFLGGFFGFFFGIFSCFVFRVFGWGRTGWPIFGWMVVVGWLLRMQFLLSFFPPQPSIDFRISWISWTFWQFFDNLLRFFRPFSSNRMSFDVQ